MIHIFKVYTEVPEKVNELAAVIKLRDDMGVVRLEKPDQFILVCGGMSAVAFYFARELESSLHVRIPCDGNADGVETSPFHHGDEFACGHRLPPGCFIVGGCALCPSLYPHVAELAGVGLQGVA